MFKKGFLASAICGVGLLAAGNASALVAGGVNFGPFGFHLETTTLAETYTSGVGDKIQGYGVVNTVNGSASYSTVLGEQLYFIFKDYTTSAFIDNPGPADSFEFTGGKIEIYKRTTFNLLAQDSPTNMDLIDNGTLWLTMTGHMALGKTLSGSGSLTGATLSFTGSGLLDVDLTPGTGLADVQAALNANDISDFGGGFADVALTTSGNNFVLNPFDVIGGLAKGCSDGTAITGAWCVAGSADLRGTLVPVPEPGSLALLGLGLVGLITATKRRRETS